MESVSPAYVLIQLLLVLFGVDQPGLPPGQLNPVLVQAAPAEVIYRSDWAKPTAGDPGAPGIDGFVADMEIQDFLKAFDRAHVQRLENRSTEELLVPEGWLSLELLLMQSAILRHEVVRHSGSVWLEPTPAFLAKDFPLKVAAGEEGSDTLEFDQLPEIWKHCSLIMVVDGGEDADRLERVFEVYLTLPEKTVSATSTQPAPSSSRRTGYVGQLPFTCQRDGNRVWLAVGDSALNQAMSRVKAAEQMSVTASSEKTSEKSSVKSRYDQALQTIAMPRMGATQFLDFRKLREMVLRSDSMEGKLALMVGDTLGFAGLETLASATGVTDGILTIRGELQWNEKTQQQEGFPVPVALTNKDFERVPASAEIVAACQFSPADWLKWAKKSSSKFPGGELAFQEAVRQMNTELGVTLEGDVSNAFGDTWMLFSSSQQGAFLGQGVVGMWEVRDPRLALTVFAELMKVLINSVSIDETVRVVQGEFLDRTIYTIEQESFSDVRMNWSICLTDKHLMVASNPQALKAQLRFLQEGGPNFSSTMTGSKAIPEGQSAVGYLWMNSPAVMAQVVGLWPQVTQYADPAIVSGYDSNPLIRAIDLPSAAAVLPYVQPSKAMILRTPRSLRLEVERPLPLMAVIEMMLQKSYSQLYFDESW